MTERNFSIVKITKGKFTSTFLMDGFEEVTWKNS